MNSSFVMVAYKTNVYQEFLAEKDEILKHKWFESEKAGYDIGYDRALIDWTMRHKSEWKKHRNRY